MRTSHGPCRSSHAVVRELRSWRRVHVDASGCPRLGDELGLIARNPCIMRVACSCCARTRRPRPALDKVSFGTNWVAQGEHGGFYQALADGTYRKYGLDVTIVPGGPNVNNRILLTGRQDRLLHERQHAAELRRGRAERPDRAGRGHLPEGAAGAARASGPGHREVRGPEAAHAVRLARGRSPPISSGSRPTTASTRSG